MSEETSKAIVVEKFGGYENIKIKEFPLPPLKGRIEVQVEYGGLNFADLYTRQGLMMDKKLPFVLGMESTGIITDLGVEDTPFKVGQRVICYNYNCGMYQEKLRLEPKHVFSLPDDVDFDVGASLFVNYLTAYFSIFYVGNLKKNDKVLIMSCAGGVGCAATQLVKLTEGVTVYGTGSASKEAEAKSNGVDVFITNENFQQEVTKNKYDLILTNQSGEMLEFTQNLLAPLGRLVILGANNIIRDEKKLSIFTLLKLWWCTKNIPPISLIMNNNAIGGVHLGLLAENEREKVIAALETIIKYLKEQKIKPKIHSIWNYTKIVEATKLLGDRKNVGKVLIKFKE